jgi:hypothetical protein
MCRPTCPFAPALFGSIVGSAAGASVGAVSGWLLYAVYAVWGGSDANGVALLIFGTLGMGIGGSGGAVGGMVEGWSLGEGKGPAEVSAAKWGAGLGGLWGLQPILWLALRSDLGRCLRFGLAIALVVMMVGAVAGQVGSQAASRVIRAFGLARGSDVAASWRSHSSNLGCIMKPASTGGDETTPAQ